MTLEEDGIAALAPDASSLKAAKGLVIPAKWPLLGASPEALWGECSGSGSKPYQVQVDLSGPAFRCSCPSRKFPCKHALGLMLLQVQHGAAFSEQVPPAWVTEWLESRAERVERATRKAQAEADAPAAASSAPDPATEARKAAARRTRMAEGIEEMSRWLADRVRQGLAALPAQPELWEQLAVRMVDAQLPGLAYRLREAAAWVGEGDDWPAQVLGALGRLQLLCDAFARMDDLPAGEQADLRAALGVPVAREQVLAEGEALAAVWQVMGQSMDEDGRLWTRRVWLRDLASGRMALVLDHAHGGRRFDTAFMTGACLKTTVRFYPGVAPLRALIAEPLQSAAAQPVPASVAAVPLTTALDGLAAGVAANPWWSPRPLWIGDGVVERVEAGWQLRCEGGRSLPLRLRADAGWQLVAEGGGRALPVFGEWDGRRLRPLSAWREASVWSEEVIVE